MGGAWGGVPGWWRGPTRAPRPVGDAHPQLTNPDVMGQPAGQRSRRATRPRRWAGGEGSGGPGGMHCMRLWCLQFFVAGADLWGGGLLMACWRWGVGRCGWRPFSCRGSLMMTSPHVARTYRSASLARSRNRVEETNAAPKTCESASPLLNAGVLCASVFEPLFVGVAPFLSFFFVGPRRALPDGRRPRSRRVGPTPTASRPLRVGRPPRARGGWPPPAAVCSRPPPPRAADEQMCAW